MSSGKWRPSCLGLSVLMHGFPDWIVSDVNGEYSVFIFVTGNISVLMNYYYVIDLWSMGKQQGTKYGSLLI